jgi:DNA mismatch repair protein MutS2
VLNYNGQQVIFFVTSTELFYNLFLEFGNHFLRRTFFKCVVNRLIIGIFAFVNSRQSNISESVRRELEFGKVIDLLENFAQSTSNKERIRHLSILHNPKVLNEYLDRLQEFQMLQSDSDFPRFEYLDLREVIQYLNIQNSVLTEDQFFDIYHASIWVNALIHFITNNEYVIPRISGFLGDLKKSQTIKKRIEKVFSPRRFIRPNASKNLTEIRENIHRKRVHVDKSFQDSKSHYLQLGYLADIKESFEDEVSLLAVASEFKRKVKGQVRGQSKTKSITFIEPERCISLNRELRHLYQDEKEEVRRILKELTSELAEHIDLIKVYKDLIEEFDFLNAKIKLAELMDANRPKVSKSQAINIKNAYHPLLFIENNNKGIKTIPQDIYFDDAHRVLVISGPNAGGKSITLKTFGLNQLMLQAGLFIPVHPNSTLSVFHDIFTDIGDNQSIENELSTYSYRLTRMKEILTHSGKSSFILIDEFGSGSDPALGGELAGVFFKEIVKSGSIGVLTTHYGNIKVLADQTDYAENACMLFDDDQLKPLYKLKVGQPGSSYTFEVAKNVGLPKSLIDKARAGLKNGTVRFEDTIHHYQRLTTELQLSQEAMMEKSSVVDAQKEAYELKLKSVEEKLESQRFIMDFQSKYLQLGKRINKIIELYRDGSTMKSILPKIRKIIEKESNRKEEIHVNRLKATRKNSPIKIDFIIGEQVRILGTNQEGEILELKSHAALLQIGFAKLEVNFEKLEKVTQG